VCVTPNGYLDKAIAIAGLPDTVVATFGDMVRVPGSESSLEYTRANGVDVRVVYSPADALTLAQVHPEKQVVFLGVGFETTIPAIAWTIQVAARLGVTNYSVLCGHKTIPAAMAALSGGELEIDGFMCPGHVSVIIGAYAYLPLARDFNIPCVVTGFEAPDMLRGIAMLLKQIVEKRAEVENEYGRSVTPEGNRTAQKLIDTIFEPCDSSWRGLGVIPGAGLRIRREYAAHDAEKKFKDITVPAEREDPGCICGRILRGTNIPYDCPLFGKRCTPSTPVGACMVSNEGTCAAYYKYARIH
jgi:hydrogenase expression/formation protein HypD